MYARRSARIFRARQQWRSAATSAKFASSSNSSNQPAPAPGKWARPSPVLPPSLGKWTRPDPATPPSSAARPGASSGSKWDRPTDSTASSKWDRPANSTAGSKWDRPADPGASSKWARPADSIAGSTSKWDRPASSWATPNPTRDRPPMPSSSSSNPSRPGGTPPPPSTSRERVNPAAFVPGVPRAGSIWSSRRSHAPPEPSTSSLDNLDNLIWATPSSEQAPKPKRQSIDLLNDPDPDPAPAPVTASGQVSASPSGLRREPLPHLSPKHRRVTPVEDAPQSPAQSAQTRDAKTNGDSKTWSPARYAALEDDSALTTTSDARRLGHKERGHKHRGSLRAQAEAELDEAEGRARNRKDKDHRSAEAQRKEKEKARRAKEVSVDVFVPQLCTVANLARLLNVRLPTLQRKMQEAGMAEEAAPEHILTSEYASLLAMEFNRNPVINDEAAFDIFPEPSTADPAKLPARPPVVTIMGHVDHGKTTLLDTLRHASVAKGEAGGITQHIGAFSVPVKSASSSSSSVKSITFLDTPGHAAFSAMRARGARVTDIVVLVVAADDGVMPQTREVIDLIKKDEGKLGVVVAINKVDKPEADVDRVQKMLLAEGLQLEVFGGDIPSVEVSGLTGAGLDQLVETLSALAEMQELRAEQDGQVQGHVLESKVHKGLGPVATVLVLRGTLKPGTHLISGLAHAKVRAMTDSAGKAVKAALPGAAVTVSGWKELPSAGEEVLSAGEGEIKRALANRERRAREERMLGDLGAINEQRRVEREVKEEDQGKDGEKDWDREREREREREGGPKELKLVIKGDVSGSVEAVAGAVQGIGNDKAVVKIVSTGVGPVTDSDVMMAKAAEGIVVAFGVNTPRSVEQTAHQNGVAIYTSDIIYRVMEEVKSRVIDLLPKVVEQRVTGEATVLQLFDIHLKQKKIMKVAGCRVVNGVLQKDKMARVVRGGATVYEGPVETLRHLKKDVQEIRKGLECGINVGAFADFQPGDLIQTYEEVVKPGQL